MYMNTVTELLIKIYHDVYPSSIMSEGPKVADGNLVLASTMVLFSLSTPGYCRNMAEQHCGHIKLFLSNINSTTILIFR